MPRKNVIFLAFANDRDDHLPLINRESKSISRALRRYDDEGRLQVVALPSTNLEDIFEIFRHYDNQVSIFHYGGHATGTHLQLEAADGSAQEGHAEGLAGLLGRQEALQLVFLNGCATRPQVALLLDKGVKAVIATSSPIEDAMATEFAEQFYQNLSNPACSLHRAFEMAKAYVQSTDRNRAIGIHRGIRLQEEEKTDALPWGLYTRENENEATKWSVSKLAPVRQPLPKDYDDRDRVNDLLIAEVCEGVAPYNPELDRELNKEDFDIPKIRRLIIDSFPMPIGEQLRRLLTSSNNPDKPDQMEQFGRARLRQLIQTYRISSQFICYALLSQLWDEKIRRPDWTIGEEYLAGIQHFLNLKKEDFDTFDYVPLLRAVTDIFDENNITYFIQELKEVKIRNEAASQLNRAYLFLNLLQQDFRAGNIDEAELEPYCREAEKQLGFFLRAFSFLVKYQLVSIKNIELIKKRHQPARYQHSRVVLDRAQTALTGIEEKKDAFANYTDSKCVLFIKIKDNEVQSYLNLTPFIIDRMALENGGSTKLYFYGYRRDGSYFFQDLKDMQGPELVVDGQPDHFPGVKLELDRFQAEITGQTFQPNPVKEPTKTGHRFLRNRRNN